MEYKEDFICTHKEILVKIKTLQNLEDKVEELLKYSKEYVARNSECEICVYSIFYKLVTAAGIRRLKEVENEFSKIRSGSDSKSRGA